MKFSTPVLLIFGIFIFFRILKSGLTLKTRQSSTVELRSVDKKLFEVLSFLVQSVSTHLRKKLEEYLS